MKLSVRKKLEEGIILGDSPLGYLNKRHADIKKEKVEVYLDTERAPLVRQIFEEYATGMFSMAEIRLMITIAGLQTKKGKKLSACHVENILKNPFYYGYMVYKGMLYKHVHPRLITKELFDECQASTLRPTKNPLQTNQEPLCTKRTFKKHTLQMQLQPITQEKELHLYATY